MAPRVSVLLPVKNAASTLAECLHSLSAQTLGDHEVIAVDDGSVDASADLLRAAAAVDPRLHLIPSPGRGLVAALNVAQERARAPLLARMDADDRAHPERLLRQAERLEQDASIHILACRVRLLGEADAANAGMRNYVEWMNGLLDHAAIVADLWVESPLAHPSVMLRAETLRSLGGYRDLDGPEDYDLWLRAAEAGCRFAKLPEVLLEWRDAADRTSRRDPRYAPERFQAVKLAALERGPLRVGSPVVIWGAGPVGKSWARALLARGHRLAAFVEVDPRKIGNVVHGAPVVEVAEAGAWPHALHLGAVARPGARARLRAEARRLGLFDGERFLAVA